MASSSSSSTTCDFDKEAFVRLQPQQQFELLSAQRANAIMMGKHYNDVVGGETYAKQTKLARPKNSFNTVVTSPEWKTKKQEAELKEKLMMESLTDPEATYVISSKDDLCMIKTLLEKKKRTSKSVIISAGLSSADKAKLGNIAIKNMNLTVLTD